MGEHPEVPHLLQHVGVATKVHQGGHKAHKVGLLVLVEKAKQVRWC